MGSWAMAMVEEALGRDLGRPVSTQATDLIGNSVEFYWTFSIAWVLLIYGML